MQNEIKTLLEFTSMKSQHSRGHNGIVELSADDVDKLVELASIGIIPPPEYSSILFHADRYSIENIKLIAEKLGSTLEEKDLDEGLRFLLNVVLENLLVHAKRTEILSKASQEFLKLEGVAWRGSLDNAMNAVVSEVKRLRPLVEVGYHEGYTSAHYDMLFGTTDSEKSWSNSLTKKSFEEKQ